MGDRYYLENLKCAYCKYKQLDEIYYAPTCNFMTFNCEECGKENFIKNTAFGFKAKKIEEVTIEEVEDAIDYCSTMLCEEDIKEDAKEWFKDMGKKKNKILEDEDAEDYN